MVHAVIEGVAFACAIAWMRWAWLDGG